jgi:ATP synthase F1 gamma subunit
MAGSKEIRSKIKSVENTRKITKAMEMVAASKMRKAQDRMRAARPYAEKIRNIAAHLASANSEYKHPFLVPHGELKNVGFIVVTSDKGLCGGLNTNLLRQVLGRMRDNESRKVGIDATAIGNKGFGFLQRLGARIVSHVVGLGDTDANLVAPDMDALRPAIARADIEDDAAELDRLADAVAAAAREPGDLSLSILCTARAAAAIWSHQP